MSAVTEVNVETGEVAERPMTTAEQQQADADRVETERAQAAEDQAERDRQAAIDAASTVAELKAALGLTSKP